MNQEVQVAGMTFVNKDPLFTRLRPSGLVTLIPEPDNKFDPNAIQVVIDDGDGGKVRIGYLPAKDGGDILQKEVISMLGAGEEVIATVARYSYHDKDIGFNEDHIGKLQSCTLLVSNAKEANVYVAEGKSFRRVTDLLGVYEPDGKEGFNRIIKWAFDQGSFSKYVSKFEQAGTDGTAMHKAIEDWMNGDEESPVPQGFLNFWDKFQPEIVAIEQRVFDDKIGVAGTYDLLCYISIKGKRTLVAVDWKSSKAVRKKHKTQVGWYGSRADADEAWVVCFGGSQNQGYGLSRLDRETCAKKARQVALLSELQSLE